MYRIFVLSPANSGGERAKMLFNPRARFDLARRLQSGEKVALGEVFSFLSGLYFRGKFTYAATFGKPPPGLHAAYVITTNRGLIPAIDPVSLRDLESFGTVEIDPADERYLKPLHRDLKKLVARTKADCSWVFLGSIGTAKYSGALLEYLGERLLFPPSFVGRGDMSRGGLLLRHAAAKEELEYASLSGAIRHGKRPARLEAKQWGYKIMSGHTDLTPHAKS